jgi:hypothetical protein
MNEHDPPKRKASSGKTTPNAAEVFQAYYIFLLLQVRRGRAGKNGEVKGGAAYVFHQKDERHCVACNVPVENENLGGHDGRPLSGRLWCLHCC